MAHPASYRPKTGEIPTNPGVYRFRDPHGRVIYVGKAKNLRSRLNSYFANPAGLLPKTHAMVHAASSVEWTVVGSELESLQLEYTWIKEFKPRFNVVFRDDKTYPYLAVTMGEKYPRVQVMRGERKKGTRYFGPYTAGAIRETMDTLLRVFPVRSCSAGVFKRAQASGRPCLLGYIDKCAAPCVGRVSPEEHRGLAEDFCSFMGGEAKRFINKLEKDMAAAVAELDYERAARLRDDIIALRKVFERNAVVLSEDTDADVFALHDDELEASVQVFHVRGGRVRGQRGWVVEKVEDATTPELIEHLLQQVYGEDSEVQGRIPREVLVPEIPSNHDELSEWLAGLRGAKVDIRVPQRGDKAALMSTVKENAEQALKLHKTRRAGDITVRSLALQELQEALELPVPLLRIECFDISHVQGTNVVASMVVVEDGLPKKSDYRKFSITGAAAADDTAAMHDVLTRRFRHYLNDKAEQVPVSGEIVNPLQKAVTGATEESPSDPSQPAPKAKFAYPPNLVVVDGGQPQVNAAARALAELGIDDVYVVGLAKRLEEVWLPDSDFPVILPRTSQGLYLLQRIRDEAHRFAITFHRQKRGKAMTVSALDGVPGLGEAKRKALVAHFGSLKKIKAASVEELTSAKGIGPALAAAVVRHLGSAENTEDAAPAINMTTGEILES
ncbi:excinuclease ABC subunit UvrC [Arthrobacter sp. TES]|uniref:UvrABC system protein C n=1 Tax=Paenarthrobacter ureafaciens TaxID=37931 RepID=A0AAX3EPA2_PAEUR|nr:MULTISPECIES: excinuclease ABC subunit UvrC [Paenarthrobacter]AMB40553.1 excinuclease ABC subunit C [Arthrobacter sp. ATCC 21022]AOY71440.1 excinuclease ABC subunit C [Arthrobacter sp. ZXY-2]ERI39406.1 excinuclease ABC subunit C [Arthrobacter sp. AK-YN10]NKR11642.1 excinuclease ABC subunit C [Arthrobacter sp. M5]NKR15706.1 excinuclease ABC subunit C [Arthrobacter sp. M6]OEH63503.1 excinuclease ABC subunit C [Arthrobacter sp. D2]QOI63300.1 excinuclease ABC subunit UvrC [Arthrobacter sp. TE